MNLLKEAVKALIKDNNNELGYGESKPKVGNRNLKRRTKLPEKPSGLSRSRYGASLWTERKMKVRIKTIMVKDYDRRYLVQYKKWGIWGDFCQMLYR